MGRAFVTAAVLAASLALAGCAEQLRTHGYVPSEADLLEIIPGVDSKATVEESLGVPTTSGVANDSAYYYIQSKLRTVAWRAPEVVDRTVVEIVFDDADVVVSIAHYGLEDGRVIQISRNATRSGDGNISFIRQLFGNIGGISAEQVLGQ